MDISTFQKNVQKEAIFECTMQLRHRGEEYYQSLKATFVSFTGIIDHLLALDDELRAKGENNV